MKKLLVSLLTIFTFSAGVSYAQDAVNADKAMREIADYLDTRLPVNTVAVVMDMQSDNQALSAYITGKLVNAIVEQGNIIPVDRDNIEQNRTELALHLTGDVSDETALSIGKMLGAETIITGTVFAMNGMYRLEIKAIAVETTALQGSIGKNILNDREVKRAAGNTADFPIGIGGGVRIGGTFATGTREEKGKENLSLSNGNYNSTFTETETNSRSAFDIGAFVFLDLKYAAINVGVYNGSGKTKWSWNKKYYYNDYVTNKLIHTEDDNSVGNFSTAMLNFGILAKYPFSLNRVTLFPALGVDYQLWLTHRENKKQVPGDLSANNAVWLKAGGGMDYHITSSLFIRTELLWGLKLPSKNELSDSFTWFTHSPAAHIGIGYTFNQR